MPFTHCKSCGTSGFEQDALGEPQRVIERSMHYFSIESFSRPQAGVDESLVDEHADPGQWNAAGFFCALQPSGHGRVGHHIRNNRALAEGREIDIKRFFVVGVKAQ